jgi:selenocysteine lyase/cysteine desulfurase
MLDDYQDCGTRPVDVKAMDLDFYLAGTLKYLLGPPRLTFLYVRKELISTLAPSVTGWLAQTNPFTYNLQHFELSPTARRFESGTPSIPNVYGAVPGFQLLQKIGMDAVADHVRSLTQRLLRFASEMGVVAKTPRRQRRTARRTAIKRLDLMSTEADGKRNHRLEPIRRIANLVPCVQHNGQRGRGCGDSEEE